jgi:hypothetical protein
LIGLVAEVHMFLIFDGLCFPWYGLVSASASAEGGEEKGHEEETEGGRVVFDENADWGTELPPYYNRPSWAPAWVPTWAVTLHPLAQTAVTLVLYFFHMLVLSKVRT